MLSSAFAFSGALFARDWYSLCRWAGDAVGDDDLSPVSFPYHLYQGPAFDVIEQVTGSSGVHCKRKALVEKGQHDDVTIESAFLDTSREVDPVHPRHLDVDQDEIEAKGSKVWAIRFVPV